MIKQNLSDIINDHKTQDEWKIQLTMKTDFISSRDSNETRTMHTASDNKKKTKSAMKQMRLLRNVLNLFFKIIKKD